MASHTERPCVDLAAGRQVLEEHLPRVLALKGQSLSDLGWRRLSDRALLIPMVGTHDGVREEYLLRLDFLTGKEWPPSAKFVNPETLDFQLEADQHHLPTIASPEVHVHSAYRSADGRTLQLICCSAVFQYYDVVHGGDDAILWRSSDSFINTVSAIERGFATHYSGRFARHEG